MTNEQKLNTATQLIEDVWSNLVPDKPPITVAENDYFDAVDETANRIISDISRMLEFASGRDEAWR